MDIYNRFMNIYVITFSIIRNNKVNILVVQFFKEKREMKYNTNTCIINNYVEETEILSISNWFITICKFLSHHF